MKKARSLAIIGIFLLVIFLIDLKFDLFDTVIVQFSKEKYSEYVSKIDYEKELLKSPVCIKDMASESQPLVKTEIENIIHIYDFHEELNCKYNLTDIATKKGDFEKSVQILQWLTKHTYYSGMQLRLLRDDPLNILQYSYDMPFTHAINCRYRAIAFADCLVAVGIKAFPVCMVSSNFTASHFTCMVFISESGEWCTFDPSFGCWFTDEDGNLLDIFELREMFLDNSEPVVIGYNFNGKQENFDVYLNCFMKLCISNLSTWADNSIDRRTEKTFSGRKQFGSRIPVN